jgi:hypothetical protein
VRQRCGLLGDAWCMMVVSSSMGVQGPLCGSVGSLHGGGYSTVRSDVEDHLGQGRTQYGCPRIPGNTVLVIDLLPPVDPGYVARVVVPAI